MNRVSFFKWATLKVVVRTGAWVGLVAVAAAACSSTVVTSSADSDAAAPHDEMDGAAAADTSTKPDAGGQVAADAAPKDAGPDTALPSEKVVVGSSTAGTSCSAVCAASNFACSAACTFGNNQGSNAGQASYTRTVNTVTSYAYAKLSTCSDTAGPSYSDPSTGSTYTLGAAFGDPISCCCLGPGHARIAGDPKAPRSCSDICKANGRTCDPLTTWTFGDKGGWEATYKCSATSTSYAQGDCSTVPPLTKKTCPLDAFKCGCL